MTSKVLYGAVLATAIAVAVLAFGVGTERAAAQASCNPAVQSCS